MSVLSREVSALLRQSIRRKIFPGGVAGVIAEGKPVIIAEGTLTYEPCSPKVTGTTVYDVASLTKSVPTACLALQLIEEGRLTLESLLIDFVPEYTGSFRDTIKVAHLLTHAIDFELRLSGIKDHSPEEILQSIFKARLRSPPGTTYCYANATSILLGLVVERVAGEGLAKLSNSRLFAPLEMGHTTFFPETLNNAVIAPSENDSWRGRVVCGEVHDESAWALRPLLVAGSAGLFSTASDLLVFCDMLLSEGKSGECRIFKPETVRVMHTNGLPRGLGVVAGFGWELDRPEFMGRLRSSAAFGKTGFTGCAMVMDPSRGAGFVLVANHTFPQRRENRDAINAVRRTLADLVFGNG